LILISLTQQVRPLWETYEAGQHYVPRLLLRTFAMDCKIRIFDLIDGTEHRTSIANVAVGTHFCNMKIEGISLTL